MVAFAFFIAQGVLFERCPKGNLVFTLAVGRRLFGVLVFWELEGDPYDLHCRSAANYIIIIPVLSFLL